MLSNPLSQIERTKDAYAGNMQGLEKRANMTKELVDLLAMQQLKKDLDAVKRNQAMQAQGNPATIKDQMQQGLMGEYRQQAAKEMGVGPSEADMVARAQQGMPQGGPRMPQGAPQQMPQAGAQQMAQGVMSQARPVQLAGGGIVAFANGSEDEGPVDGLTDDEREMQELIERLRERRANAPLVPAFLTENTKSQIMARRRGSPVLDDVEERIAEAAAAPSEAAVATLEGTPLEGALTRTALPAAGDIPASGIMLAGVPDEEPASAEVQPAADIVSTGGVGDIDTSLSLRDRQQRALDQITSMAEIEPYQRDQDLTAMLKKQMARDPSAEGIAAIERIKELSGLEESRRMLEAQRSRLREDYESAAPSRRDNLIDLLTAGGRGGITGVGVRDKQLREAEAKRRQEFTASLANIDNTAMELQRSVGTSAANNYETAAKTAQGAVSSAMATLQQADAAGRNDYVERVRLKMSSKQSLMSHLESLSKDEQAAARAALDREQITSNNALGVLRVSETSISQAAERMRRREEDIKGKYMVALSLAQNDPVKLAEITNNIKEEVTLANASDLTLIRNAESRLQGASAVLSKQGARMAGTEEVPDSTDFDTYKNK